MRRLAFSLLPVLLLAACAGAPQKSSRGSGNSIVVANGAYHAPPPGFPHFVDHSIGREEISIQAMSLVGIPYRWGGNTPDSGFDCSGLVRYVVLRAASVNLPRTTADMSGRGETIEPDEIAPGDLIFFNTTGRAHSHVGIYVGKLRFVNAPSTGGTVRLDYLTNPYWAKRFDGIRRVAGPAAAPAPFDTPSYQAAAPQSPERVAPGVARAAPAYAGAMTAVTASEAPSAAAGVGEVPSTGYAAGSSQAQLSSQQPAVRVATTPRASLSTAAQPTSAAPVTTAGAPAAQADPFEPPPPGMTAAQMQARAAGAVAPTMAPAAQASAYAPPAAAPEQTATATRAAPQGPAARVPDAIDAAADAFEPPPPASVAARQAQQADTNGGVQIMRASTTSRGMPAPTQTNDDPIARFANGNY
ncbi:peptidoglycan endopeptidase [Paraburkholderia panacisoli]|uniref:Peptidoglycan endopeptidase n=1 Tax=Paraburkholderia panacisoli TaxID=2603818 RepID=A0A5B0GRQ5_9BURK|nr:C40 family peptidase [Paraburkholderia panacisoli]KAA1005588.1 peptidoglycan endopeptidase [Paraburkholderia panacisoli]